jgi:hypothetical protein
MITIDVINDLYKKATQSIHPQDRELFYSALRQATIHYINENPVLDSTALATLPMVVRQNILCKAITDRDMTPIEEHSLVFRWLDMEKEDTEMTQ